MKAIDRIQEMRGLITHETGLVLANLASQVNPDHAIVEIGAYEGKSTCYLAYGAGANGAHVFTIEPWDHPDHEPGKHDYNATARREAFEANVKALRYSSRITAIQDFSNRVASYWDEMHLVGQAIGLLFIDGDHRYPYTWQDFFYFKPYLAEQHVIVYDDYMTKRNPGVKQAVDQVRAEFGYGLEVIDHLAILRP